MKHSPSRFFFAAATLVAASAAHATTLTKAITGSDLTAGVNWEGAAPTSVNTATWSGSSLGGTLALNQTDTAAQTWGAIDIESATANITIGTTGLGNATAFASGVTQITVANAAGLSLGSKITGTGIVANTTVTAISGNTITLSTATSAANTGTAITVIPGSVSLNLAGNQTVQGVANTGIYIAATGRNLTLNNGVALGASQTWTVGTGRALTVNSPISGAGFSLTKSGAGTMTLLGVNTYTGATVVEQGTLTIGVTGGPQTGGVLGSTGSITVKSGATLQTVIPTGYLDVFGTSTWNASRVFTVDGGTVNLQYTTGRLGNITLKDGATFTTDTAVTGTWAQYGTRLENVSTGAATVSVTGTSASSMTGKLGLRGVQRFDVSDVTGSTATDLSVSTIFSDYNATAGGFTKLGAGTMLLTGASIHTGGTNISAGTLVTSHASALGAGVVTLSGGTLQVGNGIGSVNQINIGSAKNITTTVATASVLKFAVNLGADTGSGALANITLAGGGKYDFSQGTITLDLNDQFNAAGTYHLIAGGTGNVDASSYSFLHFDTTSWTAAFNNGDLVVNVAPVPEPSTYGLIGAGALAAVAMVRRRRKHVAQA